MAIRKDETLTLGTGKKVIRAYFEPTKRLGWKQREKVIRTKASFQKSTLLDAECDKWCSARKINNTGWLILLHFQSKWREWLQFCPTRA
jgi:hypothetical protein